MVSKIRDAMSSGNFREYVLAYLPIVGIILLAIAFVAISLSQAG